MIAMRLPCLFLLVLLLAGCAVPRLIVLNDPLDAAGHNDLGVSYQVRGEDDLARREYALAAELARDWARPLINLGNVLAAGEDFSGAAASYRRALQREPENAEAMNNLAWVLLQSGDSEGALPWAEAAVARAPDDPAFLDTLAAIHLARGEQQAAAALIDRALQQAPPPELRRSLEEKRTSLSVQP
jgi:Flp pilus assembly protein TadD